MSLSEPSSRATPPAVALASWRYGLALLLGIAPWLAAGAGLYHFKSAPLAFLFYHLLCGVGGYALRSPGLPAPRKLYPFKRRHIGLIVLVANAVTLILYAFVGTALLDRPRVLSLLSARGLPQQAYPLLFPYFALVNPLAEEYFWRGGVYATLRHLFQSWVWPALVSSVLFGAWHWLVIRLFVTPPIALCATFVIMGIGFALCVVYERTRRLGYAVALHAFAGDAPLLLLLLLVGRG